MLGLGLGQGLGGLGLGLTTLNLTCMDNSEIAQTSPDHHAEAEAAPTEERSWSLSYTQLARHYAMYISNPT